MLTQNRPGEASTGARSWPPRSGSGTDRSTVSVGAAAEPPTLSAVRVSSPSAQSSRVRASHWTPCAPGSRYSACAVLRGPSEAAYSRTQPPPEAATATLPSGSSSALCGLADPVSTAQAVAPVVVSTTAARPPEAVVTR